MSSKIILVLMWTVAAVVGFGAFIVGTSAFDRYVVSDPPERAGSTPDAPAADDDAKTPRTLYGSPPARTYDGIWNFESD